MTVVKAIVRVDAFMIDLLYVLVIAVVGNSINIIVRVIDIKE